MAKYSLVMTPASCKVAGCIISVRRTSTRALTYLLIYLHSWLGEYKAGIISEKVKDRAKATINGLCKVVHWTLNDLSARFKVIDFLNAAKMAKYSLVMTLSLAPCRVICLW